MFAQQPDSIASAAPRMELPPSSRRQATPHRGVAFRWVRLPLFQNKKHPIGVLFILEQDTGVEPAFTAWEAVVLPIYESCVSGIIANRIGKFNLFLSDSLDKGCFCSSSPGSFDSKKHRSRCSCGADWFSIILRPTKWRTGQPCASPSAVFPAFPFPCSDGRWH